LLRKRLTFGLTLGRGVAPPCLVVVTTGPGADGEHAARMRVWPAGTGDGQVARHVRRLAAGRRPAVAARPADAERLRGVDGLGPLVASVGETDAALALRLYQLRRDRRLRIRAEGLEAELLREELSGFPKETGGLALALALAAWAASS
jgi:hypothetical protein